MNFLSADVLLTLLNKLGKKIKSEAIPSILSLFCNKFKRVFLSYH